MPIADLVLLHHGPEKEINVFIHGIGTERESETYYNIIENILDARPRGEVYLLTWKSGKYKSIDLVLNYSDYESRAEKIGRHLSSYLGNIPSCGQVPLNLIGHSLGARIIHYALAFCDLSRFKVKDCVMMAGAADADDDDWDDCALKVSGRIYNLWSDRDQVLKKLNYFRSPVGLGLDGSSSLKDFETKFRTLHHHDFWPELERVLNEGWPNFKQSKTNLIPFVGECPYCCCELEGANESGTTYECPYCGLDFEARDGDYYYVTQDIWCAYCHKGYCEVTASDPPEPGDCFTCEECGEENFIIEADPDADE
jgi:hypothetical protein